MAKQKRKIPRKKIREAYADDKKTMRLFMRSRVRKPIVSERALMLLWD